MRRVTGKIRPRSRISRAGKRSQQKREEARNAFCEPFELLPESWAGGDKKPQRWRAQVAPIRISPRRSERGASYYSDRRRADRQFLKNTLNSFGESLPIIPSTGGPHRLGIGDEIWNSPRLLDHPQVHGQKGSGTNRFPSLAQLFEEPSQGHMVV